MKLLRSLLAAMLAATTWGSPQAFAESRHGAGAGQAPVVRTADGAVRGVRFDGIDRYFGIPYAAPPVGDLRWQPPQPATPWRGTRDASRYANSCPQITTLGLFAGPTSVSEDCLYLNVFTTGNAHAGEKMPVIVWIHGGGNLDGASNDYDGSKLASGGPEGVPTVVVTINYRIGLLGTFSHPAINAEHHASGNYGTLDQQAALRWVQKNIAAFGGDPGRVALGGQSAGSSNVGANMLSPAAKGLFHRAILQSSPGFIAWLPTADAALAAGNGFAAAAGCSGSGAEAARCLRALSIPRILQLQGTLKVGGPFALAMPFVDGKLLPMQPEQAWASGNFNKMPVMGGATRDEFTFFTGINEYFSGPPQAPLAAAQYPAMMAEGAYCIWCNARRAMPAGAAQAYPLSDYGGDPMVAYERVSTDGAKCRELHVLQKLAPQVPTYAYDFTYKDAPFYFPKMPGHKPDAAHTVDIQFLFDHFHGGALGVNLDQASAMPRELDAAESRLSDQLVAAWTRFAATGNPNGSGDAPWPRFTADGNGRYLVQDIPLATESQAQFQSAYKCDFFDAQLSY
jgi:para-nitrobenzyl esterase